jgi:hypothetical protein
VAIVAIAATWLVVVLGGGSARPDVPYIVLVRLAAVLALVLLLLFVPADRLRLQKSVLYFIGAAALLIGLQLVPLPPAIWESLPGRAPYAALAAEPAVGAIWRPISLAPDLTWNALLSLIPPLAFAIGIPALGFRLQRFVLIGLLVTILIGAFVGLLQIAGGADSPLRYYQFSNTDSATGFLANRNHQAVLLAMGIPLAAWWTTSSDGIRSSARLAIGGSIVLLLLTAAVMTQSRMGALVVTLSILMTGAYLYRDGGLSKTALRWIALAVLLGGVIVAAGLATWADSRFAFAQIGDDLRFRILPESLAAAWAFFPVGAGVGAFPSIFPQFESIADLSPQYVNHTHSELTQIVIEGGLAAVLMLVAMLGWLAVATWRAWGSAGDNRTGTASQARLATILLILPLIGSISDYPLRTPIMACAFAAAAAMLARFGRERPAR